MKENRRRLGTREPSRSMTGACSARIAVAKEGVLTARTCLGLIAIFVCVQPAAWSEQGDDGSALTAPVAVAAVAIGGSLGHDPLIEPFIHPSMEPAVKAKLKVALDLAAERVREIEACGDLFARLGANGIDTLNASLYLQVNSHFREVQICGRDGAANSMGATALAYTKVGAASTWICRSFSGLPAELAAATVIHEALHHAGLPEWPSDRTAMTSKEITRMVNKACGF